MVAGTGVVTGAAVLVEVAGVGVAFVVDLVVVGDSVVPLVVFGAIVVVFVVVGAVEGVVGGGVVCVVVVVMLVGVAEIYIFMNIIIKNRSRS